MKIIGFNISKILVERKSPIKGKLEIKSGLDIENIEKDEVPISPTPALKFDFSYKLDYNPNIAKIEIKGSIVTLDDKDESKDILKKWKKKKFDHASKIPLFNFIMSKCNIKAIQLEDDLGLPLHIPMPKLKAQSDNNNPANYAG
jgi:hypothetical protein